MPTLWNHAPDGYGDLSDKPPVWLLPARVLALTDPGDTVQIHPDLKAEFPYILEHYRGISLPTATSAEYDLGYEVVRRYPDHQHDIWLFGPGAHSVRPDQPRFDAAQRLNDKNWFITWCRDVLKLPTAVTECYLHGQPTTDSRLTLPLFVKGAVAGAGMEVFPCQSPDEIQSAIRRIAGDYQLQTPVEHIASLNVQYYADGTGDTRHVATSEQILKNGTIHQGNRYPSRFNPRALTDPLAAAAARLGARGIFAFDVLVTPDGRFILIECNPRPNGATYYTIVAQRLGVTAWTGLNLPIRHRNLASIKLGSLEFNPATKTGLVIVNWGTVYLGIIGLLIAGSPKQQARLLDQFRSRYS